MNQIHVNLHSNHVLVFSWWFFVVLCFMWYKLV